MAGALTGFLFQDTGCKCPPDQGFADGKMSARFWKLMQAGNGEALRHTRKLRDSGLSFLAQNQVGKIVVLNAVFGIGDDTAVLTNVINRKGFLYGLSLGAFCC